MSDGAYSRPKENHCQQRWNKPFEFVKSFFAKSYFGNQPLLFLSDTAFIGLLFCPSLAREHLVLSFLLNMLMIKTYLEKTCQYCCPGPPEITELLLKSTTSDNKR